MSTGHPMLGVKINAKNDANGNPRRGWIVYGPVSGGLQGFVDEGYEGSAALRRAFPGAIQVSGEDIMVTPGFYRSMKKLRKNKRGSRRAKRTSRRSKRTSRRR